METQQRYFIILPLVYLILNYLTLLLDRETFLFLTAEDCYFETVGALCFFFTAVLFGIAYFRSKNAAYREAHTTVKNLSYLILALLFLFAAGEEISWGQRIFGIETPEAFRAFNVQGEITLHNLNVFQPKDPDRRFWMDVDRLFSFFWLGLTLVVPIAAAVYKPADRLFNKFMPVIPWFFGLLFAANYGMSKVAEFVFSSDPRTHYGIVEMKESNFAVLFAVIALYIVRIMLKSVPITILRKDYKPS